ncbi:VanZ family protein [Peptoniphilus sp. MSJ-1]|uniref:VanZ family protein n=1 Tax=Peptoniphilus ovalis TaxID=2841503 RepID=A0ABS6FHB3_9FIRM|nr:VanZ family protein [Peptoniphilus ovalis]MBU5668625.1 VanZ family protein [Peptoniphilus ovalis]
MKIFIFFALRAIPAFIITFILFSLIRVKFFPHLKKGSSGFREFLLSVLAGYIAVLFVLLFTPNSYIAQSGINLTNENFDFVGNFKDRMNSGAWGVNLVPFRTILNYIKYSGIWHTFLNVAGNIIIFIPLGILIPMIYKNYRNFKYILRISISLSFFIEFIQFFIGRSVDIDDLMLNVVGGLLGYGIWKNYLRYKFPDKKRRARV